MELLFLLLGIILVACGFVSDPASYAKHSLGQNVNLLWGSLFALFGGAMLWLSRRKVKIAGASPGAFDKTTHAATPTDRICS